MTTSEIKTSSYKFSFTSATNVDIIWSNIEQHQRKSQVGNIIMSLWKTIKLVWYWTLKQWMSTLHIDIGLCGHSHRFVQWMYKLFIDIGYWTFTYVCTVNVPCTSILDIWHSYRFSLYIECLPCTMIFDIGHYTVIDICCTNIGLIWRRCLMASIKLTLPSSLKVNM